MTIVEPCVEIGKLKRIWISMGVTRLFKINERAQQSNKELLSGGKNIQDYSLWEKWRSMIYIDIGYYQKGEGQGEE